MLNYTDIKFFTLAVGAERIKRETELDISAKCPVCNDTEARLHLYEKNGKTLVHCFHGTCTVHHNLWNFLKLYAPNLLDSYKRETFGETMKSLGGLSTPKKYKITVPITTVEALSGLLLPLEESEEGINYLLKRGIQYDKNKFGKWYFGYQDLMIDGILYKITNSIVIPLYSEKYEFYGFYSRSINSKNFITYNHPDNIGFKIWNWFDIDKELPVYIFEGIFDAISSGKTNIIAALGAKIPSERIKELKSPVFVLDNDKTGFKNSIEYAKQGFTVYIQPDNIHEKDMNEVKLRHTDINMSTLISENLFSGILAQVKLGTKN